MQYTTTSCPHCGYKTRNRETGVSNVELGQTIIVCPNCKNLIIDTFATEYEFMTPYERSKWSSTSSILMRYVIGALLFVGVGLFFFIGGFSMSGDYRVLGIIIGGLLLCYGIAQLVKVFKAKNMNIGEQMIYESLLRTSNPDYVKALKSIYNGDRVYTPLKNRKEIIKSNSKYSTQEIHSRFKMQFNEVLKKLEKSSKDIKENDLSIFSHH